MRLLIYRYLSIYNLYKVTKTKEWINYAAVITNSLLRTDTSNSSDVYALDIQP
jgi:hypothetical protein